MDEAAARMRIQIDSMPEEIDEIRRKVMQLEIEREAIRREKNKEKEKILSAEIAQLNEVLKRLRAQWMGEKAVIEEIQEAKETIDGYKQAADQAEREGNYGKVAELRYGKIKEMEAKLLRAQEKMAAQKTDSSLLKEEVNSAEIAEVVSKWTGIPVSKMLQSERSKLLRLEEELGKRVAGQEEAIAALSDAVRRSRAGLQDPQKPIGSFIFLGTTGVGKTELAKCLAAFLFNDERAMVRIDMSEYQERHAVSRLIGAPPGYVGYDEGGQLTEAVRRKPYAVILLDEIEKAHPDVFNILLQVLDDGILTDNKGRTANFKNTIIIMTSNIGSQVIMENMLELNDENRRQVQAQTKEAVFGLLRKAMRPEFINRLDEIIMFEPLSKKQMRKIADIRFADIQERLAASGIRIEAEAEVLAHLAEKGYDPSFGARPLKRIMQKELLNALSKEILGGKVDKDSIVRMRLDEQKKQILFFNDKAPQEA